MFKKLIAWFNTKRWTVEDKLFHLEQLVRSDNQWLARDPIARAITDRYLEALSDDWHSKSFETSSLFRQRLNRDPHHPTRTPIDVIQERIFQLRNVITRNEKLCKDDTITAECRDAANDVLTRKLQEVESLLEEIKQIDP